MQLTILITGKLPTIGTRFETGKLVYRLYEVKVTAEEGLV